jgi:hypothetical protein
MTMETVKPNPLYGLMAQFDNPEDLLEACEQVRDAGFTRTDAYAPFPVHGLSMALGQKRTKVPLMILIAGIIGAIIGYGMPWYANVIQYPMNIGGRPYNSWPYWIPLMFECTVLVAVQVAVWGMLGLNGLPRLHHPVFNVPSFSMASQDRFFLAIESTDPQFDVVKTTQFLESLHPIEVAQVPA